jgi:hypothetical protein
MAAQSRVESLTGEVTLPQPARHSSVGGLLLCERKPAHVPVKTPIQIRNNRRITSALCCHAHRICDLPVGALSCGGLFLSSPYPSRMKSEDGAGPRAPCDQVSEACRSSIRAELVRLLSHKSAVSRTLSYGRKSRLLESSGKGRFGAGVLPCERPCSQNVTSTLSFRSLGHSGQEADPNGGISYGVYPYTNDSRQVVRIVCQIGTISVLQRKRNGDAKRNRCGIDQTRDS